jgi:hypothetical protein
MRMATRPITLGVNKNFDVGAWLSARFQHHPIVLVLVATISGAVVGATGVCLHAAVMPSDPKIIVFAIIGAVVCGGGTACALATKSWASRSHGSA